MAKTATVTKEPAEKKDRYATLDRSREFGTVWTAGRPSDAAFFQRGGDGIGRHYDGQGRRIKVEGDDRREEDERHKVAEARKASAERLRRAAEALEAGEEPMEEAEEAEGVNLAAWGRGAVKLRFAVIREAIDQRYHKVIHNERDARDFLVEMKVITAAEAKSAKIAAGKL
jgi:hypothetical protein